jgi:hypothetical protein
MAAAALEAAECESADRLHQLNDARQALAALERQLDQARQQEEAQLQAQQQGEEQEGWEEEYEDEQQQQPAAGANSPAAEQAAQLAAQQELLKEHTAVLAKLVGRVKRLKTAQRKLEARVDGGGGAPGQA